MITKLRNHFKNGQTIYLLSDTSVVRARSFLPHSLLLVSFAAEKEKAHMLRNTLNSLPHPKVLFLSGFGKLKRLFPLLLFLKWF